MMYNESNRNIETYILYKYKCRTQTQTRNQNQKHTATLQLLLCNCYSLQLQFTVHTRSIHIQKNRSSIRLESSALLGTKASFLRTSRQLLSYTLHATQQAEQARDHRCSPYPTFTLPMHHLATISTPMSNVNMNNHQSELYPNLQCTRSEVYKATVSQELTKGLAIATFTNHS